MKCEYELVTDTQLKKFINTVLNNLDYTTAEEMAIFISEINKDLSDMVAKIIVGNIHKAIEENNNRKLNLIQKLITTQLQDQALIHFFNFYPNATLKERLFMEACMRDTNSPSLCAVSLFLCSGPKELLPLVKSKIKTLNKKEYFNHFLYLLCDVNLQGENLKYVKKEIEDNLLIEDFNAFFGHMVNSKNKEIFKRYLYFYEKEMCTTLCGKLIQIISSINNKQNEEWKIEVIKEELFKMGCCKDHEKCNAILKSLSSIIASDNSLKQTKEYVLDILYDIATYDSVSKKRVMKNMIRVFNSPNHRYAVMFFDMLGDEEALDFLKSYKHNKVKRGAYLPPSVYHAINIVQAWIREKETKVTGQRPVSVPPKDNVMENIQKL